MVCRRSVRSSIHCLLREERGERSFSVLLLRSSTISCSPEPFSCITHGSQYEGERCSTGCRFSVFHQRRERASELEESKQVQAGGRAGVHGGVVVRREWSVIRARHCSLNYQGYAARNLKISETMLLDGGGGNRASLLRTAAMSRRDMLKLSAAVRGCCLVDDSRRPTWKGARSSTSVILPFYLLYCSSPWRQWRVPLEGKAGTHPEKHVMRWSKHRPLFFWGGAPPFMPPLAASRVAVSV